MALAITFQRLLQSSVRSQYCSGAEKVPSPRPSRVIVTRDVGVDLLVSQQIIGLICIGYWYV